VAAVSGAAGTTFLMTMSTGPRHDRVIASVIGSSSAVRGAGNLREDMIIGRVDEWLSREFAPHRMIYTIRDLVDD
jgi:hypothetical protein